jgi:hypothetical protein
MQSWDCGIEFGWDWVFRVWDYISVITPAQGDCCRYCWSAMKFFKHTYGKMEILQNATTMSPVSFCTVSFFRSVGLSCSCLGKRWIHQTTSEDMKRTERWAETSLLLWLIRIQSVSIMVSKDSGIFQHSSKHSGIFHLKESILQLLHLCLVVSFFEC